MAGALAPALLVASVAVPDHAEESVRAEARLAAEVAARAFEAAWGQELERERPFQLQDPTSIAGDAPPAPRDDRDEAEVLRSRVAITEAARAPDAAERLADIVRRGGHDAPTALVALARVVAEQRESDHDSLLLEAMERVGFSARTDDLPARALALVVAGAELDERALDRELRALRLALRDGTADTRDRAVLERDGALTYTPDPTWSALQGAIASRVGWGAVESLLEDGPRRLRAIGRALLSSEQLPAGGDRRWGVFEVNGDDRLVLARPAPEGSIQIHEVDPRRLERALVASAQRAGGDPTWRWWPRLTEPGASVPRDAFAVTPTLTGTRRRAVMTSRGLPDRIADAKREVLALRLAGAVAAIALATAALAVLRTLRSTEALLRLRSTFVASVSHDLRTPVASIGLLAGNLRAGHVPEERRAQYADAIEREAARLGRLVDDLLDFGRVERGLPARVQRERVALRPWLDEFARNEQSKCAARGRALGVTLGDLPAAADLDRHALERAVSNLVDNALAHSGSETIELRASAEGDALRIDVLDEGAGTRESRLDALFEPFARGAAAGDDRSASAGTGLGLAIVRAIAEAHGGTASLERRADAAGMRARVEVPLGPAEDAA